MSICSVILLQDVIQKPGQFHRYIATPPMDLMGVPTVVAFDRDDKMGCPEPMSCIPTTDVQDFQHETLVPTVAALRNLMAKYGYERTYFLLSTSKEIRAYRFVTSDAALSHIVTQIVERDVFYDACPIAKRDIGKYKAAYDAAIANGTVIPFADAKPLEPPARNPSAS